MECQQAHKTVLFYICLLLPADTAAYVYDADDVGDKREGWNMWGTPGNPDRSAAVHNNTVNPNFVTERRSGSTVGGYHAGVTINAGAMNDWGRANLANYVDFSFSSTIGVWLHAYSGLTADFDINGYITNWTATGFTSYDLENVPVPGSDPIPEPSSALLLGLAGLGALYSKRRKKV